VNFKSLLDKPKIIGLIADVNQGKSMLLYNIIEEASKTHDFSLYYYGLRLEVEGAQRIYSLKELEEIRDSIIVIDELSSLFDLDNRKGKKMIENTLRLINHNNNILILCGTPENFKKFISAKIDQIMFKKTTIADCINGSVIKNRLLSYKGYELGSELLNLAIDEALLYDGKHFSVFKVKYLVKYDSKKENKTILRKKKRQVE